MQSDPVENIKKLLGAMEKLLECVRLQREMIELVSQQQIKTTDFIIQLGKKVNEKQDKLAEGGNK